MKANEYNDRANSNINKNDNDNDNDNFLLNSNSAENNFAEQINEGNMKDNKIKYNTNINRHNYMIEKQNEGIKMVK